MNRVLIATLGAEPQVITIAANLLLRAGKLDRVIVLHTSTEEEPVGSALADLSAHFADSPSLPPLDFVDACIPDVLTPEQMASFADTLFRTVKHALLAGAAVDLLLAGGRKPMAMLGMSVAQLLLGPADRVWYLYSDDRLRTSGRMTPAAGDHAELVAVPLSAAAAAAPVYTRPILAGTLDEARALQDEQRARQCRHFVENELTPAEREVARLMVSEIMTVADAAQRLNKQPKTLTNQLSVIYSKLETYFGLQPEVGVKREFLRRELAAYFGS